MSWRKKSQQQENGWNGWIRAPFQPKPSYVLILRASIETFKLYGKHVYIEIEEVRHDENDEDEEAEEMMMMLMPVVEG